MAAQNTPALFWGGGKCTIDDAGMALLCYKSDKLAVGMRMCFWGRFARDPRIPLQLEKAAIALMDDHMTLAIQTGIL